MPRPRVGPTAEDHVRQHGHEDFRHGAHARTEPKVTAMNVALRIADGGMQMRPVER